ncbi:hypothetical protein R9C00_16800 [Flammeovirgaceae bacterium SG7u.111]|nr:hypothetical protein [Flammeovirgaceae bacterium SG7u.132]WPO33361.1 hypothetical protein R9C00_16800 [Flammeovirgaceae bacterium SG7u.111]
MRMTLNNNHPFNFHPHGNYFFRRAEHKKLPIGVIPRSTGNLPPR